MFGMCSRSNRLCRSTSDYYIGVACKDGSAAAVCIAKVVIVPYQYATSSTTIRRQLVAKRRTAVLSASYCGATTNIVGI